MKRMETIKESGHIHITRNKAICGGQPAIKGTRISVAHIAEYYFMGLSPEEIHRELPHLTLAQIFDALAFYLDHREVLDLERAKNREEIVSVEFPSGHY
jgi:uncharacterized protein (DUF433 family)